MTDLYDMALISAQDSLIGQVIVFNYWAGGLLFGGIIVAFCIIIFTGAQYAQRSIHESLIYTGFFGSLVSSLFWLYRYNGEPSVPTLIPIMFIFLLAGAIFMKIMKNTLAQTD